MPEVKAANASEVATHKYPYWKTMADDCDQHLESACINQEQQVSSGYTGLFHQMGRCQTTPRLDSHITAELVKLFCTFGIPEIVHQTRVGTSKAALSRAHWMPLGYKKATQHPITHKEMEWSRDSTVHCSSCCGHMLRSRRTGNNTCLWPCVCTGLLNTAPLACPHSS